MGELSLHPPFVVTGASGYVASWVVFELLRRGARVRGTVRDPSNQDKCQHLVEMNDELPGTLELVKADLLDRGSFEDAVRGAGVVIHTASPFIVGKIDDARAQLIEPAVQGTKNVLDAVNQTGSVRKVVLTSSVAAVYGDARDLTDAPGEAFTEEDWNTTSSVRHQPYNYSKTLAEKTAWAMQRAQNRWTLATINPAFVLGPSKTPRADSESIKLMRDMIRGVYRFGAPPLCFGVVDVRDVAEAHVEAAIRPEAEGRYILVADAKTFLEMGQILRKRLGEGYPFPKSEIPKPILYLVGPSQGFSWKFWWNNAGYRVAFDNGRSREQLGIEYRPVEETLTQHAEQLIAAHGERH
ncbi:MAG TPA: aldehyde reductase [Polyangiales bacterium]|nr:aldehyde reductase [Polyangiales bacterium]